MSSYWAGYHGTALVLEGKNRDYFLNRCIERLQDVKDEESLQYMFNDNIPVFSWRSGIPVNIAMLSSDFAEGTSLFTYKPKENPNENIINFNGEDLIVIFSEHQLDTYKALCDRVYNNYDDLKQRYVDLLKDFLPGDFPWDDRIGTISYAVYA